MVRTQIFDIRLVNGSSTLTCDHCDLKEVDRLATMLGEQLTKASLAKHPRFITASAMHGMLNEYVDWLKLRDNNSSVPYSWDTTASMCQVSIPHISLIHTDFCLYTLNL